MHTKGNVAIQVLLLLLTAVIASAVVLWLVQSGILTVKADNEEVPILNAEFIPVGREGTVAVKDFQWCLAVDDNYNCQQEISHFTLGQEVHFRFTVESSPYNGEVMLVENYRLKDPQEKVILDVEEKNNYQVDLQSERKTEAIAFQDYFVVYPGSEMGEYTLELIMVNPLLNKKTTVVQKISITP